VWAARAQALHAGTIVKTSERFDSLESSGTKSLMMGAARGWLARARPARRGLIVRFELPTRIASHVGDRSRGLRLILVRWDEKLDLAFISHPWGLSLTTLDQVERWRDEL